MLSHRTQELAVSLLKAYIDGERQVEVVRLVLAELAAFEPYAAFQRIDQRNQGYLTGADLVDFLNANHREITEFEADLICASFSGLGSRLITYRDFLNGILPASNDRLRSRATQRTRSLPLNYECEYALCRIFERELDCLLHLEEAKTDLKSQLDFTYTGLFSLLDSDQDQAINEADLVYFCRKMGVFLYPEDVKAVFKRLDKDRDGLLSYREVRTGVDNADVSVVTRRRESPAPRRSASPLKPSRVVSSYYRDTSRSPLRDSDRKSTKTEARSRAKSPFSYTETSNQTPSTGKRLESSTLETPEKTIKPRTETETLKRRLNYEDPGTEENVFSQYLKVLSDLEKGKLALCRQDDFSLKEIYAVFRSEEGADLTLEQVRKGLEFIGLVPDRKDIQLTFRKYDKNHDGFWSSEEFIPILCPSDPETRESAIRKSTKTSRKQGLSDESIDLLMKLFQAVIDAEVALGRVRQRLFSQKLSDLYDFFRREDKDQDGFLSISELSNNVKSDAELLMARFDRDNDGKVSFMEFLQEIIP